MPGKLQVMNEERFQAEVVSFSRRGGRLDARRQRVWDDMSEEFVIEPPRADSDTSIESSYVFAPTAQFGRNARFVIEIGSGTGDTITHAAAEQPGTDFLALEVWRPGVAATLIRIRQAAVDNIRLMQADAAAALPTMIAPESVDELWLFFPDPWHKQRHRKRRLVTPEFAATARRVLKPGGVWRIATDWADYANQIRTVLAEAESFDVDEGIRFEGRPITKFERKGAGVGREIHDFTAKRKPHTG